MLKQYLSPDLAPDLRVMMLDFNAYFASVEQQLNPALRGVPVGVVPMKAETTCCIATSYEAKHYGVKTGTRVSDARKLCPGIRFVVAKHAKYVKMHLRAVDIVNQFIPVDAVLSIDEMCATLTPRWQSEAAATQLALDIKAALLRELGECMRTSIGFGRNRFLAKTASNLQKPNGLVLLRATDLPKALYHLDLESLNGIGKNMGIRLRAHDIDTVERLYQQSRSQLRTVWGGIGGELFWDKLHGLETHELETQIQSIGHSHVMPPKERNRHSACQVIDRLTQKAAMRLRKSAYLCTALTVHVGFMRQASQQKTHWTKNTRFLATDATQDLLKTLHHLLKSWTLEVYPAPPLKVGIVLNGFIPRAHRTGSLFDDTENLQLKRNLNEALDTLNVRFGKNTLYYGTSHEANDSAPMRIAFNRIPDLETET